MTETELRNLLVETAKGWLGRNEKDRLESLLKVPHIRIHPDNPARQEITAAGKQYKELMQSYLNAIKVLQSTLSRYSVEEEDAFDKWINENK